MKQSFFYVVLFILFSNIAFTQLHVVPLSSQHKMLESEDPVLAQNKKLVYDFWREVFEGGHMELVDKYLTESYIQHNPQVPTGKQGFVDIFSKIAKPKPILDTIKANVVTIIAEKDLVMICFVDERIHPKENTKKYTTTWFDMFRIENNKISEHWDNAIIQPKVSENNLPVTDKPKRKLKSSKN